MDLEQLSALAKSERLRREQVLAAEDARHALGAMPVDQTYWPDGTPRREPIITSEHDAPAGAGDEVEAYRG